MDLSSIWWLSLLLSWAYSSWTIMGAIAIKRRFGVPIMIAFIGMMTIMGLVYLYPSSSPTNANVSLSIWPPWSWWSRATQASFAHRYIYVGLVIGALYAIIGHAMVGGATPKVKDAPPLFTITNISAKFARDTENQGIIISVTGTKDAAFTLKQAKLYVNGDQFWSAIGQTIPSAIVRLVQWTVLPMVLCPSYMDASTIKADTTDVAINIAIGTKERGTAGVLHDTIRTQLKGLIAKGDPSLTLRFETAKTNWNDATVEGLLFEWTIRVSTLLTSLNGDRGENLWVSSSSSASSSAATESKLGEEKKSSPSPSSSSSEQLVKPNAMSKKAKSINKAPLTSSTTAIATSDVSSSSSAASPSPSPIVPFVCSACTFVNTTGSNKCSVCDTARDASSSGSSPSLSSSSTPVAPAADGSNGDYSGFGATATATKRAKTTGAAGAATNKNK